MEQARTTSQHTEKLLGGYRGAMMVAGNAMPTNAAIAQVVLTPVAERSRLRRGSSMRQSVVSAEVDGVRRQIVFDQATFIHNVLFMIIGAIYASFIVVYFLVVFSSSAKGASDQLTRSVVVRALAERGFVPGRVIEFDRSYVLERVSTTALGDGEFIVRL